MSGPHSFTRSERVLAGRSRNSLVLAQSEQMGKVEGSDGAQDAEDDHLGPGSWRSDLARGLQAADQPRGRRDGHRRHRGNGFSANRYRRHRNGDRRYRRHDGYRGNRGNDGNRGNRRDDGNRGHRRDGPTPRHGRHRWIGHRGDGGSTSGTCSPVGRTPHTGLRTASSGAGLGTSRLADLAFRDPAYPGLAPMAPGRGGGPAHVEILHLLLGVELTGGDEATE